jgi:hypothetical protein
MGERKLPPVLDGHWSTPAGHAMATGYLTIERRNLVMGDVADMLLANHLFMADRNSSDLMVLQHAAKGRIRWLSAQLAAARQALEEASLADDTAEVRHIAKRALEQCR